VNKSRVTVIVGVIGADHQLILKNNYKFDSYFRLPQPKYIQHKNCGPLIIHPIHSLNSKILKISTGISSWIRWFGICNQYSRKFFLPSLEFSSKCDFLVVAFTCSWTWKLYLVYKDVFKKNTKKDPLTIHLYVSTVRNGITQNLFQTPGQYFSIFLLWIGF
jgi:hypothetical protein